MKAFLQDSRLQDVQRLQRLDRGQVPHQDGELDLQKNGDRNAVIPRRHLAFPVQTRSLNLLVEIGREQKKAPMFESESLPTFGDSALSEDQTGLSALD